MPKTRTARTASSAPTFNHAMIYVSDVATSMDFYSGKLGLRVLQTYKHEGRPVYARLRAAGNSTIALHQQEPDWKPSHPGGIRLYFEMRDLNRACTRLAKAGLKFKQMPKKMPWGWSHAYLDDPDGYEVSLYFAGPARLKKS